MEALARKRLMDKGNIPIDLGPVQSTLLIPLWARAVETDKEDPIIRDPYAKEILSRIDYDFGRIESGQTGEHQIVWAVRAFQFDRIVNGFLSQNDKAAVINIGAGMDTTFKRVDDGKVLWINIEMPDTAALRQRLIPDSERELTIPKSVFDFSWIDDISHSLDDRAVLFMASGVLFYFDGKENEALLRRLPEAFPSAHFVFDAVSSAFWLRVTNWTIMRHGGMDKSALLKWPLKKTESLRDWVETVRVIEEFPMMAHLEPRKDWDRRFTRDFRIAKFLRMLGLYRMVHIRF